MRRAQNWSPTGCVGERGEVVRIVEAGAHSGDLARDILGWLHEHRPGLSRRAGVLDCGTSKRRRNWQQRKLREYGNIVHWVGKLAEATGRALPDSRVQNPAGLRGICFSNELLDAMPVHRLGWDAKARVWFEWGVTLQAGQFVWTRMPGGAPENRGQPSSARDFISQFQLPIDHGLLDALPDRFTTELCPAAEEWWRTAATTLGCGKLLTFDYGLSAEEFFMPERKEGSARGVSPPSAQQQRPRPSWRAGHHGTCELHDHSNWESAGLRTEAPS